MEDVKINVKIILSAAWAARMLASLQGDVVRFMGPGILEDMIAGTSDVPITNELILGMSILMAVPIFMSFLSLTLPYKTNRWANIIIGIFFVGFEIVFLGSSLFLWHSPSYEIFWAIVYLVFAVLVVWYAWTWPTQEG